MFLELGSYIQTSYCLYIQDHAKILDYTLWNDEWLQYSYIGAPWAIVPNAYMANDGTRSRVGNGGFSLRKSDVMNIPKENHWYLREEQGWKNEDGQICCYWRKEMLENGIRYAPIEVAAKFSYESPVKENNYGKIKTFGFHRNAPKDI